MDRAHRNTEKSPSFWGPPALEPRHPLVLLPSSPGPVSRTMGFMECKVAPRTRRRSHGERRVPADSPSSIRSYETRYYPRQRVTPNGDKGCAAAVGWGKPLIAGRSVSTTVGPTPINNEAEQSRTNDSASHDYRSPIPRKVRTGAACAPAQIGIHDERSPLLWRKADTCGGCALNGARVND
jgi:hypothetical protein